LPAVLRAVLAPGDRPHAMWDQRHDARNERGEIAD
jgi:hypothetical protein